MRLVFAGTPPLAAEALRKLASKHEVALVITREDAPVGRKRVITPSAVAIAAEELGLEVVKSNRITADLVEQIATSNAELGVVVAFGGLVPAGALELFPWWNVHFSLLPQWRGATPLQHSIMHNSGQGVTVFELETGLDTGPIVASRAVEVGATETAGEALVRFTEIGIQLVLDSLSDKPALRAQTGEATSAPKISRADARLDFELPADFLARSINALNPEPAAWAEVDSMAVKLLRAKPLGNVSWGELSRPLSAGEVFLDGNRVLVGCGSGTQFELLDVQPAGKKPMAAGDWLRGQSKAVKFD